MIHFLHILLFSIQIFLWQKGIITLFSLILFSLFLLGLHPFAYVFLRPVKRKKWATRILFLLMIFIAFLFLSKEKEKTLSSQTLWKPTDEILALYHHHYPDDLEEQTRWMQRALKGFSLIDATHFSEAIDKITLFPQWAHRLKSKYTQREERLRTLWFSYLQKYPEHTERLSAAQSQKIWEERSFMEMYLWLKEFQAPEPLQKVFYSIWMWQINSNIWLEEFLIPLLKKEDRDAKQRYSNIQKLDDRAKELVLFLEGNRMWNIEKAQLPYLSLFLQKETWDTFLFMPTADEGEKSLSLFLSNQFQTSPILKSKHVLSSPYLSKRVLISPQLMAGSDSKSATVAICEGTNMIWIQSSGIEIISHMDHFCLDSSQDSHTLFYLIERVMGQESLVKIKQNHISSLGIFLILLLLSLIGGLQVIFLKQIFHQFSHKQRFVHSISFFSLLGWIFFAWILERQIIFIWNLLLKIWNI